MTDTNGRDPDAAMAGRPNDQVEAAQAAGTVDPAREAAELKDRLLRTLADMENLRRRTEREVADARAYGMAAFARDLLAVADNMQRALEAIGPEIRQSADPGVKAMIEGVELTERELQKALEKHGITRLDPQGQRFDPNFHQAMFELPDPSVPAGTVVQVVQSGYKIGERVLRPALVGVSRGGPKAQAESQVESAVSVEPANDNASRTADV